ncbi:PPC domain-containing DNA-binding protein [Anaerorhabdus sp.]|uniref:PPC domain-containing DNA-binding protein n=1 Tax=Anaerorhabdus sp. TaxID=1872524 RepID=UPI002FC7AAAF
MKEHAFRLVYGNDLKEEIQNYCIEHHINACAIITCVGCVNQLRLRLADGKSIRQWNKQFEIVSLTGTIANGHAHIHFSGSDLEGKCRGGHLLEGTIINTTAEIVLAELETVEFSREFDESTGYDELVITNKR